MIAVMEHSTTSHAAFLSIDELANRWKSKPSGIRNRLARGLPLPRSFTLPGLNRRLFRVEDVETWERQKMIFDAPPPVHSQVDHHIPPVKRKRGRPTKAEQIARQNNPDYA